MHSRLGIAPTFTKRTYERLPPEPGRGSGTARMRREGPPASQRALGASCASPTPLPRVTMDRRSGVAVQHDTMRRRPRAPRSPLRQRVVQVAELPKEWRRWSSYPRMGVLDDEAEPLGHRPACGRRIRQPQFDPGRLSRPALLAEGPPPGSDPPWLRGRATHSWPLLGQCGQLKVGNESETLRLAHSTQTGEHYVASADHLDPWRKKGGFISDG